VDKSLLQVADTTTEAPRFTMLGTVGAYAARRLAEAGKGAAVAAAFVNHVLAMVEEAEPLLAGADRAYQLATLEEELGNVRAALGRALTVPDAATALRLAAALGTFWLIGGRLAEGRQWLDAALRHGGGAATGARGRALAAAATVATRQGDYPAVRAYTLERVDLCRKLGDSSGVADATRVLGDLALEDLAFDEAEARYRDSLALYLETGDTGGQASVLNNMGELARYRGDYVAAAHRYGESLDLCRRTADESGEARALINLGWTRLHEGDPPRASELFFTSLAIQQRLGGSPHRIAACLMGLAAGAAAAGETERTALLFGATDAILESIGASMDGVDKLEYAHYAGVLEAQMGAQALAETTGRGAALTLEHAIALAWGGAGTHP
jgi:non-specific serine/threonine protein kinase